MLRSPEGVLRVMRELPADPALPGLEWLRERSEREGSALRLVKHRPGRRMVLRQEFLCGGEAAAASASALYWKLYHNERPARLARQHEPLTRLCESGAMGFRVPTLAACWPQARALAFKEARGTAMRSLGGDELAGCARAAGRGLARLHQCSLSPEKTWSWAQEAALLEKAVSILSGADPGSARDADAVRQEILAAWRREPGGVPGAAAPEAAAPEAATSEAATSEAATSGSAVPLHRDFHPGQVLWNGSSGGCTWLDWDDAAIGPAAIDTGNFLAHLRLETRRTARAGDWRAAEEGFLAAYRLAASSEARGRCATPSSEAIGACVASSLLRLAGIAVERSADMAEALWLLNAAARALEEHGP